MVNQNQNGENLLKNDHTIGNDSKASKGGKTQKKQYPTVSVAPEDVHNTLSQHILVDGFHIVQDLENSHGSWIRNSNGNDILDGYTSFSTLPLGYNHPELLTPEFQKRIMPAALNNIANSDVYTTYYAEFVSTFVRTLPEPFKKHVFFVAGGGLAVENALKIAFDWKVRKNLASGKGEKGTKIIHFQQAFHGRTGYTMSLTNTDPKKIMYFPKFQWPRVVNPKLTFDHGKVTEDTLQKVIQTEKEALQQIEQAVVDNPDDVAGLIVESIQGEGGDNHFRPEFFQELRKLADKLDFLLIFDEVQTGFGTTGKWWAFEHYGVMPDVFSFGKKTQVCGVASTSRIDDVDNCFKVSSRINSTWGGNLVDMVRSQKYIEIIEAENLIENAKLVGEYIHAEMIKWEDRYKGKVSNARGRGLFLAVDLPDTETRNKALEAFRNQDILVLSSGNRSLRLRPALSLSKEEATTFISRMEKALDSILLK